jgi:L-aspartate oxidase
MQAIESEFTADVLIIGSGVAGLRAALALGEHLDVHLVTKMQMVESNSNYAQGGIASVLDPEDSVESHVRDTLAAGAGLCHRDVVQQVVEAGPELIDDLVRQGIQFSEGDGGAYALGREGGHSARRIVHAGDFTGRELEHGLARRALHHPRIRVAEHSFAVDFLLSEGQRVVGASVLDRKSGRLQAYGARVVVLASGGCGKVYRYTSNPDIATGDGLAMAYRAGATLANLEFVQFHPTSLFHPKARNFLISEAVRGEGAVLRNLGGEAFMQKYHGLADLAPRDVVARAIDHETKERGETHVLLDTRDFDADWFTGRFPNISGTCARVGIVPTVEGIPVVPAAHYLCGGVSVDAIGSSDLEGLYVIGESACTGLHGANRLASNSLLEALYLARVASEDILEATLPSEPWHDALLPSPVAEKAMNPTALQHDWEVARKTMWDYVGIERNLPHLEVARRRLQEIAASAEEWAQTHRPQADLYELRNLARLGSLITQSALARPESRGLQSLAEHPGPDPRLRGDTCLRRDLEEPWLRPLRPVERSQGGEEQA